MIAIRAADGSMIVGIAVLGDDETENWVSGYAGGSLISLTVCILEWIICARATRSDSILAFSVSPVVLLSSNMYSRVFFSSEYSTMPVIIVDVGRSGSMWINLVGLTFRSGRDGGRRSRRLSVLSK